MKCCPHCEHLNELTQIQCEICSRRLTQAIRANKKRYLSSAGTGKKLKCQDEGMTLISVIALIVTTILVSLGGVKGNQMWNDRQESKKLEMWVWKSTKFIT